MRILRTNEIVEPRTAEQAGTLQTLLEHEIVPRLYIVRDEAGARQPGIRSYTASLRRDMHCVRQAAGLAIAERISLDTLAPVRTVPSRDLSYIVRDLSEDPEAHKVLVMSPTEDDYEKIIEGLAPEKDVDAMRTDAQPLNVPCTPLAIGGALRRYNLWRSDLNTVLVGRGRTVGAHVDGLLRQLHREEYYDRVRVITKSNEGELPDAMAWADTAIIAAGKRHQITPDMVRPGLKALVGVCIEDIHPDVYDLPGNTLVTPRHGDTENWGIGMNTSSIAIQRTFDAAMQQLAPAAPGNLS